MIGLFKKVACAVMVAAMSFAPATDGNTERSIPHADGYWTDGYWDGANNVWVDGYWTETDGCNWVEDWNHPDGGYCSAYGNQAYYAEPSWSPSYIKVGSHYANLMYGMDQWIVDMPGTAALFDMNGKMVIADHAYQGFGAIRSANTADYGGQKLTLASRYYANWWDGTLILSDGREFTEPADGWLIMYTCTGAGATVTYWN